MTSAFGVSVIAIGVGLAGPKYLSYSAIHSPLAQSEVTVMSAIRLNLELSGRIGNACRNVLMPLSKIRHLVLSLPIP